MKNLGPQIWGYWLSRGEITAVRGNSKFLIQEGSSDRLSSFPPHVNGSQQCPSRELTLTNTQGSHAVLYL